MDKKYSSGEKRIKMVLTPLRWVGGKARFVKHLDDNLPTDFANSIEEVKEPFVGGGSVFLYLKTKYPDKRYWINDIYYNLYCFWCALQNNCDEMLDRALKIRQDNNSIDKMRLVFDGERERINSYSSQLEKAVSFLILNKCSFSGLTEQGAYAPQAAQRFLDGFSTRSVGKLKATSNLIQGVKITNEDYGKLLNCDDKTFVYLDPPYKIKGFYYGKNGEIHKAFDHELFYDRVGKCEGKVMISYNASEELKKKYSSFKIKKVAFSYGMSRIGDRIVSKDEMVVCNF